jgi:hypothetical protein
MIKSDIVGESLPFYSRVAESQSYCPILQGQGYMHEADQQPMKEVSFKVH